MDVIFRVVIRGRVQGVGFRAWAEVKAIELGVQGWARNCRDGSVEALLAGPENAVLRMIELCRDGPPGARVETVDQRKACAVDLALRRSGEMFSVLPSA
jgi:acylphosphatase